MKLLVLVALALTLAACGTQAPRPTAVPAAPERAEQPPVPTARRGGYYQDDGPGDSAPPDLAGIPDAVPRAEPLHRFANNPYAVFGQDYVPLKVPGDYRARGIGSWYGRKFHGQKTSSGEPYDMYGMTAAHGPIASGGSREEDPLGPPGDYANSCVGRERVFTYFAARHGTRVAMDRLYYAIDLRYGVLRDVADKVWQGAPVDVTMGVFNCIWQRDANDYIAGNYWTEQANRIPDKGNWVSGWLDPRRANYEDNTNTVLLLEPRYGVLGPYAGSAEV